MPFLIVVSITSLKACVVVDRMPRVVAETCVKAPDSRRRAAIRVEDVVCQDDVFTGLETIDAPTTHVDQLDGRMGTPAASDQPA